MKYTNMKIKLILPAFLLVAFVPLVAHADFSLATLNFKTLVEEILSVINVLVPILFSLAFVTFFWGLSKFILNSNKAEEIAKGKSYMLWSILALFILISFRTIIVLVSSELDIGNSANPALLKIDGKTPETGGRIITP